MFAAALAVHGAGPGSDVADAVMKGDAAAVRALWRRRPTSTRAGRRLDRVVTGRCTGTIWRWPSCCCGPARRSKTANRDGTTPLALAALDGNAADDRPAAQGRSRCEGARPERRDDGDVCGANGNPAAIKMLVAAGADVNAKENLRSTTALMWAAAERHAAAVKALVELGADVGAKSGLSEPAAGYWRSEGRVNSSRGRRPRGPSGNGPRRRAAPTRSSWSSRWRQRGGARPWTCGGRRGGADNAIRGQGQRHDVRGPGRQRQRRA